VLEGNCDGVISDAKVFSHVYDPGDPSTWSFAYRSTADVCLGLIRITGADQAPVITVTSTPTGSTTATMDSPSVLPQGADDLLMTFLGAHGNGAALTSDHPAGMTDLGQTQVAGLYMSLAAAHEALTSSAPTGIRSWTNLSPTGFTGGTISIAVKSPASADPLDPIVNAGPPPWIARQIAMAQTRIRPTDEPPLPGPETGRTTTPATAAATAVKVASCTGRTSAAATCAGTETRTDVYIAETFSSVQSDGLGNGSAITTARTYAGDWLIVAVTDSQSTTPPTKPGGWSDIALPDNVSGTNFEVFLYALLNPAAQTTYTWTVTGGRRTIEGTLVRGANTTTLLDEADSLETVSGTSHASPSVTTLGPNRVIIAVDVLRGFPTSAWAQASGWLEYLEAVGGDATTNMQVSIQARTAPTAGAYSDTFVCAVAEPAIVVLLAVIPAVGGSAGNPETGNATAAATAAGRAVKIASQTGRATAAATAASTDRKTALAAATATSPATAASTSTKRAADTGRAAAVATSSGTETTSAARAQTGTTSTPAAAASTARRTAAPAGLAAGVAVTTTTARKTAVDTGRAVAVPVAAGTSTSSVARAQTGNATIPARCTATARKTATTAGSAAAPARCTTTARKTTPAVGAGRAAACTAGTGLRRAIPAGGATAVAIGRSLLLPAYVAALVGLDGGTSAGSTDSASRSSGAADGRTGSSGHDSTLKAAGSGGGTTTATGYL
jgi:hypothetical protein